MGVEPASVRGLVLLSVRPSTLSNMNISKPRGLIAIKFYLKHHWGEEKAVLSFGADRFRTLVSMTADNSHRVIMGKRCCHFFSVVFHPIFINLQVTRTCMKAWTSSKLGHIRPPTAELAAFESVKNPH